MCLARNRRGEPIIGASIFDKFPEARKLTDEEKEIVRKFKDFRQRQFDANPPRGLRPSTGQGWQCPNCGKAHGPEVTTCPEPPRDGSLKNRIGQISNG